MTDDPKTSPEPDECCSVGGSWYGEMIDMQKKLHQDNLDNSSVVRSFENDEETAWYQKNIAAWGVLESIFSAEALDYDEQDQHWRNSEDTLIFHIKHSMLDPVGLPLFLQCLMDLKAVEMDFENYTDNPPAGDDSIPVKYMVVRCWWD